MWFCRHDDAALRPFARGLDPATFRSWGFELGSRSHPHSEEWMCFFEPDASFRDLQRLTASHGHVPACPILARRGGFPHERSGGVVALSSIRNHLPCDRFLRTHQTTTARRAVSLPDDQARDPVPSGPKTEARHRLNDDDMTVARAGQPRVKVKRVRKRTLVLSCDRNEAPRRMSCRLLPHLQRLAPCSPFSTRCRAPRVAHEDGRPGWCPSVRTSCAEAHFPLHPREGMHFPLDRGAFHRWNPTTEGIAPCVVGQGLCATHPAWGFADEE